MGLRNVSKGRYEVGRERCVCAVGGRGGLKGPSMHKDESTGASTAPTNQSDRV